MTDAELDAYAEQLVAGWPPLTPDQQDTVRRIFSASDEQDAA